MSALHNERNGLVKNTATHQNNNRFIAMDEWFDSSLGQELLAKEQNLLDAILGRRFGYHLLQLGCSNTDMYSSSPIGHKFTIAPQSAVLKHSAIAKAEAIPLSEQSIDLVILHHALDFSDNPHQLLREVSRILIAGGHVIIIGFNPFSSWGIRKKLQWKKSPPWDGKLFSALRLSDWLKLLDFQVDSVAYGLYSLPINSPKLIKYSSIMDSLATRFNWPTGGIYIISASKQVIPLTPIQASWKKFTRTGVGMPIAENISSASRSETRNFK